MEIVVGWFLDLNSRGQLVSSVRKRTSPKQVCQDSADLHSNTLDNSGETTLKIQNILLRTITMKTAVVCWCLFSITFALPIPEHNTPHANALRESNVKQNSHSSSVSYNAKSQKDSLLDENYDTEKQKDPTASSIQLFNRDTKHEHEAWDSELGSKNAALDSDLGLGPEELPASQYDAVKTRDFLLDMSDADTQAHEHSHSSEVNHAAEADEHSHSSEENHDAEAEEDSLVLNARNGIAGWQRDDLYEENYAANNPEMQWRRILEDARHYQHSLEFLEKLHGTCIHDCNIPTYSIY
ncbi:hypothetical protein JRQ81_016910 [Phrynocephalus forsythii]|uniref:Uncharacterized protein n=1 Tax=Phrynocephalus forsythii TaxID=171643 RepID=A0A9Q0XT53_9SAUR|nr:hypothetical protein JRQ81_016910 [Phrynocephalus forsythii]